MSDSELHSPPSPKTQVIDGRYRLIRLIGIGGMGAVYEAEHVAIGRRVALKILHPQFSQHADLVERLRREAQAASRIGHPNIVDVTDFGRTEDGSAYLTMEFLVGTDLGAILRERGQLNETRALRIGLQTAQALAAAHRVGIVHRDLKPENIFIVNPIDWPGAKAVQASDRSGVRQIPRSGAANTPNSSPTNASGVMDQVKILDFGVAVQLGSAPLADVPVAQVPSLPSARLTNPGLTVGTPEYMAPEQATGSGVDARADIYAVGTLLYEMVSGRVPFVSPSVPELLTMKTGQAAPSPRAFAPAISSALEALILRCLERDPAARPQTMEEVEEALLWVALAAAPASDSAPTMPMPLLPSGLVEVGPSTPPAIPSPEAISSDERPVRVGPAAGSSLSPPAVASGELSTSGTRPVPQQSRFSPGSKVGVALLLGAAGLVIVGFASARYFARRTGPAGPSSPAGSTGTPPQIATSAAQPAATAPTPPAPPVEAPRPAMATPPAPALPPPAPGPTEGPSPEASDVKMLVEWARRAADGRRYTAPDGDNLVELLARLEEKAGGADEAKALREETVRLLNREMRDGLRRHRPLEALDSFRALHALVPDRPLPRREILFQLLFQARSGGKGREPTLAAAHGAVEVAPSSAAAHLALADAMLTTGKRETAAAEYRRTLELHPRPTERHLAEQGLVRLGKPVPAHHPPPELKDAKPAKTSKPAKGSHHR